MDNEERREMHELIRPIQSRVNAEIATLKGKIERVQQDNRALQSEITTTLNGTPVEDFKKFGIRKGLLRKILHNAACNARVTNLHEHISNITYNAGKKIMEKIGAHLADNDKNYEEPVKYGVLVYEDNRSLQSGLGRGKRLNRQISEWERGESVKLLERYFRTTPHTCFQGSSRYSSTRCPTCGAFADKCYIQCKQSKKPKSSKATK
ncbi:MAG: hypothetical protein GF364_06290, partial [Candidatus Lokiarchaeota archaeon]|nr:hypothetical protein [Candidatus Lokiarchaeota archaeon]